MVRRWVESGFCVERADQLTDTLNHMQKPGADPVWEIAVPNGSYEAALLCGDPAHDDSVYRVAIEGDLVLDATPDSSERHFEVTTTVDVEDGRLTVSNASGAENNKICSIEISAVPSLNG